MVHGVLLPLTAFISLNLLLFALVFKEGSWFTPFWYFVCCSILVILISNGVLMIPKWTRRWSVWLIGLIIPVCILAVEILFLGFILPAK